MEIWKDIKGYEGLYQVSNLGRIKSLGRTQRCQGNKQEYRKERIMKQHLRGGYYQVSLCKNSKHKHFGVHRLVALVFLDNPEAKEEVNHKNGIKTDNRVDNLEWVTRSENAIHAYRELKINPANARKIKCVETGKIYSSTKEAAKELKINLSQINNVIAKRYGCKTAGGLHWEIE